MRDFVFVLLMVVPFIMLLPIVLLRLELLMLDFLSLASRNEQERYASDIRSGREEVSRQHRPSIFPDSPPIAASLPDVP